MELMRFYNPENILMKIEIIGKGDSYGRDNLLIHDKDDPLVEFHDLDNNHFISRYYASTLCEKEGTALLLEGSQPHYWVNKDTMNKLRKILWNEYSTILENTIKEDEKSWKEFNSF